MTSYYQNKKQKISFTWQAYIYDVTISQVTSYRRKPTGSQKAIHVHGSLRLLPNAAWESQLNLVYYNSEIILAGSHKYYCYLAQKV